MQMTRAEMAPTRERKLHNSAEDLRELTPDDENDSDLDDVAIPVPQQSQLHHRSLAPNGTELTDFDNDILRRTAGTPPRTHGMQHHPQHAGIVEEPRRSRKRPPPFVLVTGCLMFLSSALMVVWYAGTLSKFTSLGVYYPSAYPIHGRTVTGEEGSIKRLNADRTEKIREDQLLRTGGFGGRTIRNGLIRRDRSIREDPKIQDSTLMTNISWTSKTTVLKNATTIAYKQRSYPFPRAISMNTGDLPKHNNERIFTSSMGVNEESLESQIDFDEPAMVNRQYDEWDKKCVPMKSWQTKIFTTCNSVHEIDLSGSSSPSLLSAGGSWRMAWRVASPIGEEQLRSINLNHTKRVVELAEPMAVLKVLLVEREFDLESFHNSIVDSIAMERLTASNHVVNEYAFCGASVITEVADGDARSLVKRNDITSYGRLILARNLAEGLADIHGIDDRTGHATFTHNDVNIANIVQVEGHHIKYNDFNIGILNKWNVNESKPCGFPVMYESIFWRSPEEIRNETYVSEKVDVFSLGNVLYYLMAKHEPWKWLEPNGRPSVEDIANRKMRGELPFFPTKLTNSNDIGVQSLFIAIQLCWTHDPEKRPSAHRIATSLSRVINAMEDGKTHIGSIAELKKYFTVDP
eukprot:scaffold83275_cov60-Attheya_sp.AAC.1